MSRLFLIGLVVAAVVVIVVGARIAMRPSHVTIADEFGQKLVIPRNYVTTYSSLVRAFVPKEGGDAADRSIPVTLSEAEVDAAIPAIPHRGREYGFLLHLLPPWQNYDRIHADRVQEILERKNLWREPHWQPLKSPGWFRVHDGTFDQSYQIVRAKPESSDSYLTGEWVASCVSQRCLTQFSVHRIAVDVYLSEDEVVYRDDLRRLIGQKISEWK